MYEIAQIIRSLGGATKANAYETVLLTQKEMQSLFKERSYYEQLINCMSDKLRNRSIFSKNYQPPDMKRLMAAVLRPLAEWLTEQGKIEEQ